MMTHKKQSEKQICNTLRWVETTNRFLNAEVDKKARILVQANGLLTTILLANAIHIPPPRRLLLLPVGIQLVSSLIVIATSLVVTKPRLFTTNVITNLSTHQKSVESVYFDGTHLYWDLLRDVHQKAVVLAIKCKYLRIAYHVFITGLCLQLSSTLVVVTLFVKTK